MLLLSSRAGEVTLRTEPIDGGSETSGGSSGVVFAVGLEGVYAGACGIVRLLELVGLDISGFLESTTCVEDCSLGSQFYRDERTGKRSTDAGTA